MKKKLLKKTHLEYGLAMFIHFYQTPLITKENAQVMLSFLILSPPFLAIGMIQEDDLGGISCSKTVSARREILLLQLKELLTSLKYK